MADPKMIAALERANAKPAAPLDAGVKRYALQTRLLTIDEALIKHCDTILHESLAERAFEELIAYPIRRVTGEERRRSEALINESAKETAAEFHLNGAETQQVANFLCESELHSPCKTPVNAAAVPDKKRGR